VICNLRFETGEFGFSITNHEIPITNSNKFLGSDAARKKDLAGVKLGVARFEAGVVWRWN
jgi:hypothetical protein